MRINCRKWINVVPISVGMLAILGHFQNCAPSGTATAAGGQPGGGEVRIVDDWATTKVDLFAQAVQAEANQDTIAVDGVCARQSSTAGALSWEVRDPSADDTVLSGVVDCERGGFRAQISDLSALACDTAYSLEVRTEDGSTDQAILVRRCAL